LVPPSVRWFAGESALDALSVTEPSPRPGSDSVDAEELFHEYSGPVYRYCLARLGSPEEAEDAVQVTFLNAWRGLRQGIQPEEPRAWLFTIAANVSSTLLRSRLRGGKVEVHAPEDFEQLPSGQLPDDEVVDLDAALKALPARQRQALLLRYWRGLSYAEIAAELAASKPAVETLLFRARRAIAESVAKPARRIPRPPLRSALPAFFPSPSALSGVKSLLLGGGTAKALAVTVGAAAPLVAFGIVERTLLKPETHHAGATPVSEVAVRFEGPQVALGSAQPAPEVRPLRASAALARKPAAWPKTVTAGTKTKSTPSDPATVAGGAAPASQPIDSTQPSPPPSTASDPPAAEPEAGDGHVVICHVTGSKKQPEVTISVAPAAVDAHLAHGDQLGACAS
jgi:RNA polymerase sigma-70 factor, ECF subfamily